MYEIYMETPKSINPQQLISELEALIIPQVRTYSIIGSNDICNGVYAWSDLAPTGTYEHMELSAENEQLIISTINAHNFNSIIEEPVDEEKAALCEAIIAMSGELDELKARLLIVEGGA